jgi:alpha-galactosidase
MIRIIDKYIKIDTVSTTLLLRINNKNIEKLYYGRKLRDDSDYKAYCYYHVEDPHASIDDTTTHKSIFSCSGDGNNRESYVLLQNESSTFINRFEFVSASIINDYTIDNLPNSFNKLQTLKLSYFDAISNVTLNQYISVFLDSDVISFSSEIVNDGSAKIYIKRLMSLQLDLHDDEISVMTFDGAWARERHLHKTKLNPGCFYIDSKTGLSSNAHNPFLIIETKMQGLIGFNLIYSGNHKEIINYSPLGMIRVLTGLNDYNFNWEVEVSSSFKSPEAIMVYGENTNDITFNMHQFAKHHIINQRFVNELRPILINNWEATYFNFNRSKLMELASKAKDIGIELFVLDDGWFGKRDSDNCSLGDWFDYKEKTGGLVSLSKEIRSMGMKFGIWVEPEMISFISELYKNHPDYMMRLKDIPPIEKRQQQMLDLVNEDVQNYIIDTLSKLFEETKPDYVKWDCNRPMTDIFSSKLNNQGEYYHRYVLALYNIISKITSSFPNILFESCSAGGNRFDLGMLYYMPQTWASDNSDAKDRLYIQEGTLYGYPQNSMGSHVSICPNHQTGNSTSLESRFNVASIGAFGYEMDLTKCSELELATIKNQVQFYKHYRPLLQQGNYYRLGNVFEDVVSGWIVVNEDKSKAIATIVITQKQTNWIRPRFKLCGLNNEYRYHVTMRKQTNIKNDYELTAYGDVLNSYGLDFGNLFDEADRLENSNSIATRMIVIERIY